MVESSAAGAALQVIMDVDTGVDDAAALALATRLPGLNLIGVTTVAGNVDVDKTTDNTLRVLAAVGRNDVPVYRGMSAPLARPLHDASEFHGTNGLGNAQLVPSPAGVQDETAPDFIVRSARELGGDLTLVCVGPQTNLAVALNLEPRLTRLVRRVVVMGGVFQERGNSSPFAEFNIWADPEAAAMVARSELPLTYVGLDVTHQVLFRKSEWEALEANEEATGRLIRAILRRTFVDRGQETFPLHDPLAVGVALHPELVTTQRSGVVVQVGTEPDYGLTSLSAVSTLPSHEVALGVQAGAFLELFRTHLRLA